MGVPNHLPTGMILQVSTGDQGDWYREGRSLCQNGDFSSSMDRILLVFCRLVVCLVGAFSRKEVMKRSSKCNMFRLGSIAQLRCELPAASFFCCSYGAPARKNPFIICTSRFWPGWWFQICVCSPPKIKGSWSTSTYAKMFIEKGWLWKPPTNVRQTLIETHPSNHYTPDI